MTTSDKPELKSEVACLSGETGLVRVYRCDAVDAARKADKEEIERLRAMLISAREFIRYPLESDRNYANEKRFEDLVADMAALSVEKRG